MCLCLVPVVSLLVRLLVRLCRILVILLVSNSSCVLWILVRTAVVCCVILVRCFSGPSRWCNLADRLASCRRPRRTRLSPCRVPLPCWWRPRILVVLLTKLWWLLGSVRRTVLRWFRLMTIRTLWLTLELVSNLRMLSRW